MIGIKIEEMGRGEKGLVQKKRRDGKGLERTSIKKEKRWEGMRKVQNRKREEMGRDEKGLVQKKRRDGK